MKLTKPFRKEQHNLGAHGLDIPAYGNHLMLLLEFISVEEDGMLNLHSQQLHDKDDDSVFFRVQIERLDYEQVQYISDYINQNL